MTPEENELSPEVYQMLASGRKIEAIRQIREETGLGLREAKELADAISGQSDVGTTPPPPEMKEVGGARGGIAIVIAIILAYLAYVFFLSE